MAGGKGLDQIERDQIRATLADLDAGQRAVAHKGWAAVGLTEILGAAGVPKGSFYHWFASKDAFGEAMLQAYFATYLAEMDATFAHEDETAVGRLMDYWQGWRRTQSLNDCEGKCLAVKLGAEVADLSEPMRRALKGEARAIVQVYRRLLDEGYADAGADAGAGLVRTYPGRGQWPPLIGIDHILTKNSSAVTAQTVVVPGADHRGLLSTVRVPVDMTAS
mgnify:CR=1 FL=1